MKLNSTVSAKAVLVGVVFSISCSSDKSSAGSDGGAGSGNTDGAVVASGGASGATHGSGGKGGKGGGTSAGGSGAQNQDASTAGSGATDGSTGADGSTGTDGSAGAGGASAKGGGGITITQVTTAGTSLYSVDVGFARSRGTVQGNSGETCTPTTSGSCIASVCTFSSADSGPSTPPLLVSGLNAGVIDVKGAGASKAELTYGPVKGTTISAYKSVEDPSRFFMGGDELSVVGAGGPDLPAFGPVTLTAPNEIVLTAPACAAGCPPVDRTKDMAVTWTGGGAGKLTVTLETVAADSVTIATCDFDAKGGKGTVPKGILGLLGMAGDATTTGVESFISGNSTTFMVGDLPTTFTVDAEVAQGSLTVSK